jgi:hypothetical protein
LLQRAGAWFLQSGIQEQDGGVARYYRSDLGENAHISTEITGYAVSFLFDLFEVTARPEYREAGERAARFLARRAWSPELGVFPFEHSGNGTVPDALAYFFDSGIIVRGLLSAWRATHEPEYRDTAVTAGRGMLAHFQGAQAIHPILTLPSCTPRPYEPRWSAAPGCYQLKAAMAWFDLFELTGEAEFGMAYDDALERAVETEECFLPGDSRREKVMDRLHAYLYFLEGLLPRAGENECAALWEAGIERVASFLREIEPSFVRSDVYAQLLRMRLYAADAGVVPLDTQAAAREAECAAAFQLTSSDPRVDGGFGFGRRADELSPYVNPVSTAFCVQALRLWDDYQHGCLCLHRRSLI